MDEAESVQKSPKVSVWGPPEAGKTSFLAGLYREAPLHDWRLNPINDDAGLFVEKHGVGIMKGKFPPATNEQVTYNFRMFRPPIMKLGRMLHHEFLPLDLVIVDAPGRYTFDTEDPASHSYWRNLSESDAILIMIDAQTRVVRDAKAEQRIADTSDFLEDFMKLLNRLQRSGRIDRQGRLNINLAICLTKIDEEEPWKSINPNQPYQYLKNEILIPTIGGFFENQVAHQCWRCFALSVVGRCQIGPGITVSNRVQVGDHMEIRDFAQWNSIGLLQPLEWIIERYEALNPQRGRFSLRR